MKLKKKKKRPADRFCMQALFKFGPVFDEKFKFGPLFYVNTF